MKMEKRMIYKTYGLYSNEEIEDIKKDMVDDYIYNNELFDEELDTEDGTTYEDFRNDVLESNALNEYVQKGINDYDYEDIIYEMNHMDKYNETYLVNGILGLWWGKPDIEPTEVYGLTNAIYKCLSDAWDFEIWEDENEDLHVDSYHHDGTNHFIIRKAIDENESESIMFRRKVWGCR